MEYLQYLEKEIQKAKYYTYVLNLIINGIPSIRKRNKRIEN